MSLDVSFYARRKVSRPRYEANVRERKGDDA